jgi:HSP20 family molecular chaperone IbpA
MNNHGIKTAKIAENAAPSDEKALMKNAPPEGFAPVFVEAEKMFEHLADVTKETALKAYQFFLHRGGEFGREFDDWFRAESEILMPVPVEITETEKYINIRAAVPGFKPEEIEVSVKNNLLILRGITEMTAKKEDEYTTFSEWSSNKFFRQLMLSSEVNAEKVSAKLKDGILLLKLPKMTAREPTQVPVNSV